MLQSKAIALSSSTGRGSDDSHFHLTSSPPVPSTSTLRSRLRLRHACASSTTRSFLAALFLFLALPLLAARLGCRAFSVLPRSLPSAEAAFSYRVSTSIHLAAGMFDFLSPARYALEKSVASRSIPDVSDLPDRIRVQDFLGGKDEGDKFDHSLWTSVLQRHVSAGHAFGSVAGCHAVDYDGVANDPDFASYLALLQSSDPSRLSRLEQLAFWMNAYNALCVATIVHHEKTTGNRLASILRLSSGDKGPVWDQAVPNCQIEGKDITLNEIEHQKLRGVWAEPRVHACIVCASASCPNLRREAFRAEIVGEQMNDQMKDWVSNPTKGFRLTPGRFKSRVELSRIFLWFAEDFGGYHGLAEWLPQFEDDPKVTETALKNATVRYFEYDWQVNRAPSPPPSVVSAAAAAAVGEAPAARVSTPS